MIGKLITIVIPVYNAQNYLEECINSILNQTYTNIEIILINDGSTDRSLDICNKYNKDYRIRIVNKQNEGLSKTRQIGLDLANGEYFCTIDADDYIEKTYIEEMYLQIEKNNSDICVCGARHHSGSESKVFKFNEPVDFNRKISEEDVINHYNSLTSQYYMSDSWNKLYRMEFIKITGVKFSLPSGYKGNDLLFNYLLLLHLPSITVVNEPLYNYRISENTLSRKKNTDVYKGFLFIISKILAEVNSLNYSKKINNEISSLFVYFMYYSALEIYNAPIDVKEKNKTLDIFFKNTKKFIKENSRLSLNPLNMNSFTLMVVCFCFNRHTSQKLLMVLRLRSKLKFNKLVRVVRR